MQKGVNVENTANTNDDMRKASTPHTAAKNRELAIAHAQ